MDVLVFANGAVEDGPRVQRALHTEGKPFVIAADGGARVAQYFGCPPDVIIGDMDSLPPDELSKFATQPKPPLILCHPPEKDETDLELALKWAAKSITPIDSLVIIGGLGDRFDQTLANVYLLALPALKALNTCMVAGAQEIRLLRPGLHTLAAGAPGDTVSLIPLSGTVKGVRTEGLYYPLHDETLAFGPARGVSNVIAESGATVSLRTGSLLLIHIIGRA